MEEQIYCYIILSKQNNKSRAMFLQNQLGSFKVVLQIYIYGSKLILYTCITSYNRNSIRDLHDLSYNKD